MLGCFSWSLLQTSMCVRRARRYAWYRALGACCSSLGTRACCGQRGELHFVVPDAKMRANFVRTAHSPSSTVSSPRPAPSMRSACVRNQEKYYCLRLSPDPTLQSAAHWVLGTLSGACSTFRGDLCAVAPAASVSDRVWDCCFMCPKVARFCYVVAVSGSGPGLLRIYSTRNDDAR